MCGLCESFLFFGIVLYFCHSKAKSLYDIRIAAHA